jgi:hypothetical protein
MPVVPLPNVGAARVLVDAIACGAKRLHWESTRDHPVAIQDRNAMRDAALLAEW